MGSPAPVADQIEFRWQPDKDLSPVAASFDIEQGRAWSGRLSGLTRPATPDPAKGVPAHSVTYQCFDNGMTALVWRSYDEHALPLSDLPDSEARHALVARALIARAELLQPDLAITLCRADAADQYLGLAPGQVPVGARLPQVGTPALLKAADPLIDELDEFACREDGAEWLVAAGLRDSDTPLSVLLPGSELTMELRGCPQLVLLWALWRTTALLTMPPPGMRPGRRGWSFSTYEPPLGTIDPSVLARTVFRSYEQDQMRNPPKLHRQEAQVRPRYPEGRTDHYDETAAVLLGAYRQFGGTELEERLRRLADQYPNVDARLQACVREFGRVPGYPGEAAIQPHAGVPDPDPLAQQADEFIGGLLAEPEAETRMEPVGPGGVLDDGPSQAAPVPPRHARPAPAAASGLRAGDGPPRTAVASSPDGAGARPGPIPRRGQRGQPWTLPVILDRINAGPEHPDFDEAQQLLIEVPSTAEERSKARNTMPGRRWYVHPLSCQDPFTVEQQLAEIFTATVIPDMHSREVPAQLAAWAKDAPAAVIKGLSIAAHHESGASVILLEQALQPELYRRWLNEHSIYFARIRSDQAAAPAAAQRHRPFWQVIPNGQRTGVIASLLAWVCLALVVALVWKFL
jgi:hypothetical protein